jgi:hypothetical protein
MGGFGAKNFLKSFLDRAEKLPQAGLGQFSAA